MSAFCKFLVIFGILGPGIACAQAGSLSKEWQQAIQVLKKEHPYTGKHYSPGESVAELCMLSDSTVIDTCRLELTYTAEILLDTLGTRKTLDLVVVEIGRRMQKFYSRICWQSLMNHTYFKRNEPGKQVKTPAPYRTAIDYALYRNAEEAKITNRHLLPCMKNRIFEYDEPMPRFAWEIDPDTLTIAGYACYKARAEYAGRHWTVWFTTELPLDAGPWKFNGLPGVVLEACDAEEHFHFSIRNVEQVKKPIVRYDIPTRRVTREEFRALERKLYRHPFNSPSDFIIVPNPETNQPQFLPDDWQIPYNPIERE